MKSLYSELILDHYQNPRNYGKIVNPTKIIKIVNPFCGDRIEMAVKIKKDQIDEIKFRGEACAIATASASLLTEYIKGKKIKDLKNIDKTFMINLVKVNCGPTRLKCLLLPWEGLMRMLEINFKSL
jgi:nitrogen fixation NifU-like protein